MSLKEREIIEDILDEFDFSEVHKVMTFLKWVWHPNEDVPTLGQLRKRARFLMESCFEHEECTTSTGGFWVQKRTFDGEPYYRLMFVVEEWNNYE